MQVKLKSNYNNFMRHIQNLPDMLDESTYFAVDSVMERLCEFMANEIQSQKDVWCQQWSTLELIDNQMPFGTDIKYEIKDNVGTIYIGRDTPKIEMSDGTMVNPYYFIEFGWGIRGEENPIRYHEQNQWSYNINDHTTAWWYIGYNGKPRASYGRQGIDFLYKAMQKFKPEFKKELGKELNKRWYTS